MTARGTLPVSPLNRREWAEAYLELRLKPIPLDGKTPQIRWRQFKTRVPRPDEIVESFDDARVDSPSRNIGLVMRGTGLVVVDCDGPNAPDLLIEHGIDLDRFPHHVTGSGNPCYWARTDVALRDRVALLTDGRTRANGGSQVDIKADGVVTVPPSVHPDTRRAYVWKSPFQNVSDVPLLPTRLLELIERHNPPGEVVSDGSIPEGQRHDCLLRMLGAARRHGADEASLMALAKAVNRRCTPELPPSELRVMVQSLLRYPPESRPNISPPVSFRSASDICAEVPEGLDFIVAPYLVGGAIADLHGSPKSGRPRFAISGFRAR